MALPASIDPTKPLGTDQKSQGDNQFRDLKLFLADILGLPTEPTDMTAAMLSTTAAGLMTILRRMTLSKGADIASTTALVLGTDGNYFDVTGTTTITSITGVGVGTFVTLHFDGILTLTHSATDLDLPSGTNIITAAGDELTFVEYAAGDWRMVGFNRVPNGVDVLDSSLSANIPLLNAANVFTAANAIKRKDSPDRFGLQLFKRATEVYGLSSNLNDDLTQQHASFPSWDLVLNCLTSTIDLAFKPAAGSRVGVFSLNSDGKQTAGIVPLARVGVSKTLTFTSVLNGTTSADQTITHGLGTDDITVVVRSVNTFQATGAYALKWTYTDATHFSWTPGPGSGSGYTIGTLPATPATGDIKFNFRNDSTITLTITFKVDILRRS